MYDRDKKIPMWVGGILLALVLILVSNRSSGGLTNPVLIGRFVPRPADPGAPTAQAFQLPQVHFDDSLGQPRSAWPLSHWLSLCRHRRSKSAGPLIVLFVALAPPPCRLSDNLPPQQSTKSIG